MRLVSVNVGLPREVAGKGGSVSTGIFKEPVQGRVTVRRLNLDGDRQADLSVHGGADKAVYAYPAEHYSYWRGEWGARQKKASAVATPVWLNQALSDIMR